MVYWKEQRDKKINSNSTILITKGIRKENNVHIKALTINKDQIALAATFS